MDWQSYLPYVIALLTVGLVMGPLVRLVPGPRQRLLGKMRAKAYQQGLRVEHCPRPAELPANTEVGMLIRYARPRLRQKGQRWQRLCWWRAAAAEGQPDSEWQGPAPRPQQLGQLPGAVVMLEVVDNYAAVYWIESNQIEDVDRIDAVLQQVLSARLGAI